jgi:hypothetical protein
MIEQDATNFKVSDINQYNTLTKIFTICSSKLRPSSKRNGVLITVFALLFTFMLVNGYVLSTWNVDSFVFGKRLILIITCVYAVTFGGFWILLSLLAKWVIKPTPDTPRRVVNGRILSNYFSRFGDRKFILIAFCILLFPKILIWFLYGAKFPPDSFNLIRQAAGFAPLQAHMPIINVLVVTEFMTLGKLLGDYHIGIYLWTFTQSIAFTACFAYVILFLRQIKAPPIIQILGMVAFSVMPIFAVAGIAIWSDILFSSFAVLFVILSYKLIKNPPAFCSSKSSVIGFILITFLFATWRNNGYYALIIAIPFLIIVLRAHWKRIVPLLLTPLTIATAYFQILIPAIAEPVTAAESLSVPLQQIARSVFEHSNEMSAERIAEIAQFFNVEQIKAEYNPILADPVKNNFRSVDNETYFSEHKREFIDLWLKTIRDYPITSLNATLYNTKGFWYLFNTNKGASTDIIDDALPNVNFEERYNGELYASQREQFSSTIRAQAFNIYREHLFPYRMIFSVIPFYLWLLITCVFVLLIRHDRPTLISLAGIFGVIITIFAGPVADFRYLFCLPLMAPILFAFIFNRPPTKTEVVIPEP